MPARRVGVAIGIRRRSVPICRLVIPLGVAAQGGIRKRALLKWRAGPSLERFQVGWNENACGREADP